MQMLSVPVQSLAMAIGRPQLLIWREAGSLLLRLPVTLLAAWQFGLTGAAAARGISGVVIVLMNMHIASSVLNVSVITQLKNCHRSLASVVVMSVVVAAIQVFVPFEGGLVWKIGVLAISAAAGVVVYMGILFLLWRVEGGEGAAELWMIDRCRALAARVGFII
jgi:PST family polysaccharide transporter